MSRSLLKYARITNPSKDEKDFETAQVTAYEETFNVHVVNPYGLYSTAPMDSMVMCLNMSCQEENRAGIAYNPRKRFKNYAPGEVGVGNPTADTFVKFNKDGDVEVQVKRDLVIKVTRDGLVTIEGNAEINVKGDASLNVDGDVDVTASNADVTASQINLNGDTTINGDLFINGNIASNGSGDLGGAGIGVARLNDQVLVTTDTGTWPGVITTASATYKVT